MPHQYIGHVNFHWMGVVDFSEIAGALVEKVGCSDAVVVLEYGSQEGHPHFHYWFETTKSKPTVITAIKSVCKADGKVCMCCVSLWF